MKQFRLWVISISKALFICSLTFWVISPCWNFSIKSQIAIFLTMIFSFAIFLLTAFPIGSVDQDECTIIRWKIEAGYTRQDLYDEGYTKFQLDDYELKRGEIIPTTSPEEEEKKS